MTDTVTLWDGKRVDDMSREELVEVVKFLGQLYETERDAANHYRRHQFDWAKLDWVIEARARRDAGDNAATKSLMARTVRMVY